VDIHQGPAVLEWWANRSTCLGSYPVDVTVAGSGSGWSCRAVHAEPLSAEHQEGFDFLMELGPVLTLRFPDESTIEVDVVAEPAGHLTLTVWEPTPPHVPPPA
jgi:hypothetical protein